MATTLNRRVSELSHSSGGCDALTTHPVAATAPDRQPLDGGADRTYRHGREMAGSQTVWLDWTLIALAIVCLLASILVTIFLVTPIE